MKYANQITIAYEIVRWTSSNKIPPADCLQQMVNDQQITTDQMIASLCYYAGYEAKAKEIEEFGWKFAMDKFNSEHTLEKLESEDGFQYIRGEFRALREKRVDFGPI